MFVLRLSHSGKAVHVAYANETQESFFDGFVTAFEALGGVPGRVRLDNLKPAVIRVLLGRARLENMRFVTLRIALRVRRRSTAGPVSRGRTRRVGWRARSAGSAAAIWSRSPWSARWPS